MAFKWLADGDSVTRGYGLGNTEKSYLQSAAAAVTSLFGQTLPDPTVAAVPGYGVRQMLAGGPGWNGSGPAYAATGDLASKLAGQGYDAVTLMSGINDALQLQAGTITLAGFKADVRGYVSAVLAGAGQQGRRCCMVLMTPTPVTPPSALTPASQDAIARAIREVAAEYANNPFLVLVDVAAMFRPAGLSSPLFQYFVQTDGIHINGTGHGAVGAALAPVMYWRNALPAYAGSSDLGNPAPRITHPAGSHAASRGGH